VGRIFLAAVSLALGCGGQKSQTIDPTASGVTWLLWAADGSEVFYLSEHQLPTGSMHVAPMSQWSVSAAKTDGSGTRIIDSGKPQYAMLFMPPDGSSVYYLAGDTSNWALFEALQPRQVATFAAGENLEGFAASPDDRHVAYFSNGALRQLDTTDGSSVELVPAPPPPAIVPETIVYSPTGDRIFYLASDTVSPAAGGTVDVATKAIDPDSGQAGQAGFASWSAAGLHVVWMPGDPKADVTIEDIASRQLTTLWRPPHAGGFRTWSPDGTDVALSDVFCAGGDFGFGCPNTATHLYVVSIDSGAATLLEGVENPVGPVAFSPDGRRLAFLNGKQLSVIDVR
jgi:dipeptidyl aminopeptidase/acylaminoacyl peptidase